MTALRFYVGIGFNARKFAVETLLPYFGGATVQESYGLWMDPDGTVFDEPGHVITVAVESYESAQQAIKFARHHAHLTGEHAVMVEYHQAVTFVDALRGE